jgi:hypothetical protein
MPRSLKLLKKKKKEGRKENLRHFNMLNTQPIINSKDFNKISQDKTFFTFFPLLRNI